jgi:hypothetical protein
MIPRIFFEASRMVSMDSKKAPEVWDQLTNESGRAYEAFKVYMFLSPAERSLVRAWREWTANPEAARPSPFFEGWAREYAWPERARAHDAHIERIRRRGMEEAIQQEAAKQARQAERVRGRFYELMAIAYERAITYLEDDKFGEQLRPADVVQILKLHLEATQKLGDASPQTPDSGVDWSEDEQRELDRILDEIDAEEAQEQSEEGSSEDSGGDHSEEGPEETG